MFPSFVFALWSLLVLDHIISHILSNVVTLTLGNKIVMMHEWFIIISLWEPYDQMIPDLWPLYSCSERCCSKICFRHSTCWLNFKLIKLNSLLDSFSRALIDKRMRHIIRVFILSCLLAQGISKSLPPGPEIVVKSPDWAPRVTGDQKIEKSESRGRGNKVFSFQDTLDTLGWGNILWVGPGLI